MTQGRSLLEGAYYCFAYIVEYAQYRGTIQVVLGILMLGLVMEPSENSSYK